MSPTDFDEMGLTGDEIGRVRLSIRIIVSCMAISLRRVDECRSFPMNYLPTKWEAVHRHPPHGGL